MDISLNFIILSYNFKMLIKVCAGGVRQCGFFVVVFVKPF